MGHPTMQENDTAKLTPTLGNNITLTIAYLTDYICILNL